MFKSCFLIILSVCLTLLGVEGLLRLMPAMSHFEQKIEMPLTQGQGYANCYTSNPRGYFPLQISYPRSALKSGGSGMMTLYCLPYDALKRRQGFFPKRSRSKVITGDSFTFGEGVKDEDTLGFLLGERLSDYNILNYGETAANTRRVRGLIEDMLKEKKNMLPDGVIYFFNLNDVEAGKALQGENHVVMDFENVRWPKEEASTSFLKRLWLATSLGQILRKAWLLKHETERTQAYYHRIYFDKANESSLQSSWEDLTIMQAKLKEKGIPLTIVIYPLLYKDMTGHYPFADIHGLIKDFCRRQGIRVIDGLEAFRQDKSMIKYIVHPVDYHPNGLANETLVNFLVNEERL